MYDTVLSRLHETAQQSRIGASDRSIGMTFQRHIDGDLLARIQLFEGLVAIVCAQVAFLQFFEGGIDGLQPVQASWNAHSDMLSTTSRNAFSSTPQS